MQILKEGKPHFSNHKKETCTTCGCEFTYDKNDLETGITPPPRPCRVTYVTCPWCGKKIYIG